MNIDPTSKIKRSDLVPTWLCWRIGTSVSWWNFC